MSSPSHCRPTIPPKPMEKIAPTNAGVVISPSLVRQTVGTQVNMYRKQSSSISPPPSSSKPRLTNREENQDENSKKNKQQDELETVNKSSKPALPPKPNSSALKKGATPFSPPVPSSSSSNPFAAQLNSLISEKTSTINASTTTTTTTNNSSTTPQQKSWGQHFGNVQLKPVKQLIGVAPVAHIDELENLSDISNSPSPIKSALTTTPTTTRPSLIRPPVFHKPFQKSTLHSPQTPHGLPKSPNHPKFPSSTSSSLLSTTTTTSPAPFSSLPVSPRHFSKSPASSSSGQVFNFPATSSTPKTSHIFTSQQIEERRGKATSLGRNFNFNTVNSASQHPHQQFNLNSLQNNNTPNNNSKKSFTLSSRISPLDLSTSAFMTHNNQNKSIKSPTSAPVKSPTSPSSILQFGRQISFSPDNGGVVPPPPPPRIRRKLSNQQQQHPQETNTEVSNNNNNNNNGQGTSTPSSTSNKTEKPQYATVDKEKKWTERLLKQQQMQQQLTNKDKEKSEQINEQQTKEDSSSNNNTSTTIVQETVTSNSSSSNMNTNIETVSTNIEKGEEEEEERSIVNSTLTITSWLGKFIQSEKERHSESTTDENTHEQEKETSQSSSSNNQTTTTNNNTTTSSNIMSFPSNHNNIIIEQQQKHNSNSYNDNIQNVIAQQNTKQIANINNHITVTSSEFSNSSSIENHTSGIIINHNTNVADTKFEQKNNNECSKISSIKPQEEEEEEGQNQEEIDKCKLKDNLCRNESFLYAMQEPIEDTTTNITTSNITVNVDTERETDNIASKEIDLSISSTVTLDEHNDDDYNGEQTVHVNSSLPTCNIDNVNNSITVAPSEPSHIVQSQNNNNNINVSIADNNISTLAMENTTNQQEQQQQQLLLQPQQRESVSSVSDVFEKQLENTLEHSYGSSQLSRVDTFNIHKPSEKYRNNNNNNHTSHPASSETKNINDNNNGRESQDPSTFLEFVDSRLQSMQNLLASVATTSPSTPGKSTNRGVSFDVNVQNEEGNVKNPDGDIIKDILLTSERFSSSINNGENNATKSISSNSSISSRRATAPELATTKSQQNDYNHENNNVQLKNTSENTKHEQEVEGHESHSQLSSLDSQYHHHHQQQQHFSHFQNRRSWTLSDYSPSPSDSSSSSGSLRKHQNRKQTSSLVDFIDDDELSTGHLGDAESDAPTGCSSDDVGENKIARRKHGIVRSIFGSFGKSGSSSGYNASMETTTTPRRSQFFLDSSENVSQNVTNNNISESNNETNRDDKTRSLPPPSSLNFVPSPPPRVYRSSLNTPTSNTAPGNQSNTSSPSFAAKQGMTEKSEGERKESLPSVLGETSSARSSICYDEILADLPTKYRKSFFVAREILTSEKTFVDVLNLLTIDFPLALKLASDTIRMSVISSNDLEFILGGLPTLKKVNEVLVSELETRVAGWKESPKVADIIVKTGPFLKHYSTYVRDFERIVQRLDHCCAKNPAFLRALKDFEANERCQKLGIKHYMLKPVQRMPQYRLLLEDYLKTLDEECEDYNDTIKAIAIVREVAEHANEAINLQINAEKLMNLQNRLPNIILLRANRFLLKEGELLKVCRKELQPRYFALMTDVLLCMTYNASSTSGNMKDLKLRYDLSLTGMRIALPASEDYSNEFSVICTTRSFNVVAKTCRERDEWMKALSAAIEDNIKKRACTSNDNPQPKKVMSSQIGAEAPVWIQDKRVTMCQVCTSEFTVTYRRHHCRACGRVVCGNCSGNQAPLAYQNYEAARVCESCYQYLLEEFDRENCERHTQSVNEIRSRFKKVVFSATNKVNRQRKSIPDKFKISGNAESQMSGYLQWNKGKKWKRNWFVLMERVLYIYAASEDVVAQRSIPVLGYSVESVSPEINPGVDPDLMFKLTHTGQNPIFFMAENYSSAQKWMTAIQEATVLN